MKSGIGQVWCWEKMGLDTKIQSMKPSKIEAIQDRVSLKLEPQAYNPRTKLAEDVKMRQKTRVTLISTE